MKEKIEEIIVVEGKDDTKRLKEVFQVDTIETRGSAIDEDILEQIEHAEATRGVIVFTDPDFSGEKIRKRIMEVVPSAKHAFLARAAAVPHKQGSLGVEHASDDALREALEKIVTPAQDSQPVIPRSLLFDYGLIAGPTASLKREKLGEYLKIGYTNAKQLEKRLAMFRISEASLAEAMKKVEETL